jgi:tryptophan synthase alpha chain
VGAVSDPGADSVRDGTRRDPGSERIAAAFAAARTEGRAALVCYLPAGYPDLETSEACLRAAAENGADLLEVGFPFSDPVMDGPIIQAAAQHALDAGLTVDDDLALCGRLTASIDIPAVVMTYYTIPSVRGLERFAADTAESGLAGAILPDLPVSEAAPWRRAAADAGLATIFLAASTSSDARIEDLVGATTGFVYATAVLGVTGVRAVAGDARGLVGRIHARTRTPVAVGIGVSDAEQAADVATYADGVIVGSALVRAVGDGDPEGAPQRVAALVRELRRGVERRGER